MSIPIGLMLDIVLVILLVSTLGYCVVLSRKLDRFRNGQGELRQVVTELATATVQAERAIKGLKITSDETNAQLSDKLRRARALVEELTLLSAAGARLKASGPGVAAPTRDKGTGFTKVRRAG